MLLSWLGAAALALAPVPPGTADTVPLYTDLGFHHKAITTAVPAAQAYFDQGLRLVYAFNHGEAIRSFREAARLDPACAMCYWGIALAYGPHVNAGMDSAAGAAAWEAIQAARRHLPRAGPAEREYIEALSLRYASPPPGDRAALDSAYARAMAGVAARHPDDLDAATLYAEALMDLRPWDYWTRAGAPQPGTGIIMAQLERVLAGNPDHPGACHYYIHAVEAVAPEKAVPCAERLAGLMPGAGHIVHMPAHIYIRVGRYNDAIESNRHAVHADEVYIEGQKPEGIYPIGYYPHNYHFLAFAATMAGRSAEAIAAAQALVERSPVEVARAVPPVETYLPFLHLTYLTFGRWAEVLGLPSPPPDLVFATGQVAYAHGVAWAATGRPAAAEAALDTVTVVASRLPEGDLKTTMQIAMHSLRGEIALRGGRAAEAVARFREAAALEDAMLYFEPPSWYYPVRHSLGMALLRAGDPAGAEAAYREDLARFPGNGWALFGLAEALRAGGKADAARAAVAAFEQAWALADVTLTGSRY